MQQKLESRAGCKYERLTCQLLAFISDQILSAFVLEILHSPRNLPQSGGVSHRAMTSSEQSCKLTRVQNGFFSLLVEEESEKFALWV